MTLNIQEKFEEEIVHSISHNDFENITELVYGKKIQIFNALNGTYYKYTVSALKVENEYMKQALKDGFLEDWQYDAVFNDLCAKGHIQEGNYLLYVSW